MEMNNAFVKKEPHEPPLTDAIVVKNEPLPVESELPRNYWVRQDEPEDHIVVKKEPEHAEAEPSWLVQFPVASGTEDLQDVFVKEETQLSESYPAKKVVLPDQSTTAKDYTFKCYICDKILENKVARIHHLMVEHKAQDSYRCDECHMTFKKIMTFNNHLAKHDTSRPFQCSSCAVKFSRRQAMLNHEYSQHGIDHGELAKKKTPEKKHQCGSCDSAFPFIGELKRHEQVHHRNERHLRCEVCDGAFSSMQSLESHLKVHNEGLQKVLANRTALATRCGGYSRSVPTCNVCQGTFRHSSEIEIHFRDVHPEANLKVYHCNDCDEVFFTAHSRNTHQYRHKDQYACDQCGKRHYNKQALISHRHAIHGVPMGEEKYVSCSFCGRKVARVNYREHLQTHQKGEHTCNVCDKRFHAPSRLRMHMRLHTEVKPYGCDMCENRFTTSRSLIRHQKKWCSKKITPRIEIKHLATRRGKEGLPTCNVCKATFQKVKEIVTHFKEVHPLTTFLTYDCGACEEIFFTPQTLYNHRYIHSDKFACNECGQRHLTKQLLDKHRISAHSVPLE